MRKITIMLPPEIKELKIPASLFNRTKYPDLTIMSIFLYAYIAAAPKKKEKNGIKYVELSAADAMRILGCKDTTIRDECALPEVYCVVA